MTTNVQVGCDFPQSHCTSATLWYHPPFGSSLNSSPDILPQVSSCPRPLHVSSFTCNFPAKRNPSNIELNSPSGLKHLSQLSPALCAADISDSSQRAYSSDSLKSFIKSHTNICQKPATGSQAQLPIEEGKNPCNGFHKTELWLDWHSLSQSPASRNRNEHCNVAGDRDQRQGMAREPLRLKREINEQDGDLQGMLWSLPEDTSSMPSTSVPLHFQDPSLNQQPISMSSSSIWDMPVLGTQELLLSDRHLFQGLTPQTNVPAYFLGTHISNLHSKPTDANWQMALELDRNERSVTPAAAGALGLPYMDAVYDTGFLSFTQCLQEGMNMDVADYSDLARSVSAAIGTSHATYHDSGQQEKSSSSFLSFGRHERSLSSLAGFGRQENPTSSGSLPSNIFEFPSSLTSEAQAGGPSGEASTVPGTPNSSMSSSSSDGHDEVTNRAAAVSSGSVVTQVTPDKASEETVEKQPVDAGKKKSRPRKKGQKRNREPRIALVTKSDVEHLEDGYRWRKYGQKAVKNSPFPRSYYRCTNTKCSVKKRVERSSENPSNVITTYEGQHTHHSPAVLRGSTTGAQFGAARGLASFNQSAFTFPTSQASLQVPRSNFDLAVQLQQQDASRLPPYRAHQDPQPSQSASLLTDEGLLEDMLPPGVRQLS